MDSTAPEGATIDPSTGIVSWTPTDAQASGSCDVTIHATDDGVPPMTSTATYTIRVKDRSFDLILVDLGRSGNSCVISWQSEIGKTYQVEYKDPQGAWTPFGAPVLAAGPSLSITDDLLASPNRVYRVVLVPHP